SRWLGRDDALKMRANVCWNTPLAGTGPVAYFHRSSPDARVLCLRWRESCDHWDPMPEPKKTILTANDTTLNDTTWATLPKILLHEHLDGGLRPQTLLDLCRARNLDVPVQEAGVLGDWM